MAEAKSVLATEMNVQLVFSDVQMPGDENGFALAIWVRQNYPGVKVILTSGMAGAAEKARDLCDQGPLMEKPYEHGAVLLRIQEALRSAKNNSSVN